MSRTSHHSLVPSFLFRALSPPEKPLCLHIYGLAPPARQYPWYLKQHLAHNRHSKKKKKKNCGWLSGAQNDFQQPQPSGLGPSPFLQLLPGERLRTLVCRQPPWEGGSWVLNSISSNLQAAVAKAGGSPVDQPSQRDLHLPRAAARTGTQVARGLRGSVSHGLCLPRRQCARLLKTVNKTSPAFTLEDAAADVPLLC